MTLTNKAQPRAHDEAEPAAVHGKHVGDPGWCVCHLWWSRGLGAGRRRWTRGVTRLFFPVLAEGLWGAQYF